MVALLTQMIKLWAKSISLSAENAVNHLHGQTHSLSKHN